MFQNYTFLPKIREITKNTEKFIQLNVYCIILYIFTYIECLLISMTTFDIVLISLVVLIVWKTNDRKKRNNTTKNMLNSLVRASNSNDRF